MKILPTIDMIDLISHLSLKPLAMFSSQKLKSYA